MDKRTKFTLDENEIPRQWYNILADLPEPADVADAIAVAICCSNSLKDVSAVSECTL